MQPMKTGILPKNSMSVHCKEGDAIVHDLCSDIPATEAWCRKILDHVESELRQKQFTIFLDIDGVLDVFSSKLPIQELLPETVERLRRLVTRTKGKVVVISDWRYGSDKYANRRNELPSFPKACEAWSNLKKTLNEASIEIADVTPWQEDLPTRTDEINAYLQQHPEIYNYVILDDCFRDNYSSNPDIQSHLVFVDALKGAA